jgi:hypothetical protein
MTSGDICDGCSPPKARLAHKQRSQPLIPPVHRPATLTGATTGYGVAWDSRDMSGARGRRGGADVSAAAARRAGTER